jgi:hypothetical protein
VTNVNDLPLVLTARDVQRLTRLDKTGTYALLHEAGCPTLRFGRAIRVLRDPFLAWLEQRARTNGQ